MRWREYPLYNQKVTPRSPQHWRPVPMWTLFRRVKRTGFPELELLSVYRDHGVIPKSSRDDNFNKPSLDLSAYQRVDPGCLVVNKMKAWQGSVAISQHTGIVSPAYFVFEPLTDNRPKYLHYLLRSQPMRAVYGSISVGIRPNQWDLDPWQFSRLSINLPSPEEQWAIADFLDRETAKIDALIAKQEELIATLQEDRAATITHAVTKGLDPDAEMTASGIEWIGLKPSHWPVKRMSWLFSVISSGTTPDSKNPTYYGGEINWVTTGELREGPVGRTSSRVTSQAVQDHSALRVYQPGALLIAMYGATIGRLGILEEPACTNQACCVFDGPQEVEPKFAYYALWAAREHLITMASGGGQPNINQEKLRSLRVPVPPSREQKQIIDFLDRRFAQIDDLISKAGRMIAILREYRSALITDAVTGKIDVREAV